jgi:hypothetical protein
VSSPKLLAAAFAATLLIVHVMTHYKNIPLGGYEVLRYGGGSEIQLRGPSAQILTLQGDGPQTIQWAPEDYRGLDVEMRVEILDWLPFVQEQSPPDVRFQLQFGHGRQTYSLPQFPGILAGFTAGAPFYSYSVPARGYVHRMTSREIKMLVMQPSRVDGGDPYPTVRVAVSYMPTSGMAHNSMPLVHYSGLGTVNLQPFPIEAREWRISNLNGAPFAALAATVNFLDPSLAFVAGGSVDAASLADWTPIPMLALFWGTGGTPMQATFR